MKTVSFIYGIERNIKAGTELYFGQLWGGDGNGEELLESGSVCLGEDENRIPVIVAFEIAEKAIDIINVVVHITDIY